MKNICKRILVLCSFFALGGFVYQLIELCYRGRTTVEMYFLGGICSVFIACINNSKLINYDTPFLLQGALCSVFITVAEYICGIMFNADYHIWDYRTVLLNVNGQICIPYTIIWFALSLLFIPVLDWIDWQIFDYKPNQPPFYKIFGVVVFRFKG